jgi:hypothetical protein
VLPEHFTSSLGLSYRLLPLTIHHETASAHPGQHFRLLKYTLRDKRLPRVLLRANEKSLLRYFALAKIITSRRVLSFPTILRGHQLPENVYFMPPDFMTEKVL